MIDYDRAAHLSTVRTESCEARESGSLTVGCLGTIAICITATCLTNAYVLLDGCTYCCCWLKPVLFSHCGHWVILFKQAVQSIEEFDLPGVAKAGIGLVQKVDIFISETEPFRLAKDESKAEELASILYQCIETVRIAGVRSCLLCQVEGRDWLNIYPCLAFTNHLLF